MLPPLLGCGFPGSRFLGARESRPFSVPEFPPQIVVHYLWHDEVRRTTRQPHLSAIVQARGFSLFGHTA